MTTPETTALTTSTAPKPQMMVRIEQHIAHLLTTPDIRERFAAVLMQQIRVNPALQKCTPESVLAAIVRMAQLQLDPALPNECWLVPFKNEATCIVGYGGLRKLALRSPEVRDLLVVAVHEQDTYESPLTPVDLPTHRRPPRFAPRGRVIGYFAAALLSAGHWRVLEMSREEVKVHRDRYARSASGTFWAEGKPDEEGLTNFDKMALKTVLRQLCSPRHLSLSAEVHTALGLEEQLYARINATPREVLAPQPTPALYSPTRLQENSNDLYGDPRDVAQLGRSTPTVTDAHAEEDARGKHGGATFLAQITAAWEAQGLDEDAIAQAWQAVCVRYGVQTPEQLKMSVLPGLLEQARHGTLVPPVIQGPQEAEDDAAPPEADAPQEEAAEEEIPF